MHTPCAPDERETATVTVDDTTAFLAKFENGALGTFEASRMASGRKNHERIEINGSKGSLSFNFERMNELEYWSQDDGLETQGFRTIIVTEEVLSVYSRLVAAGPFTGLSEHLY
ncbi:Gfo/Idh/MocA family oxidoreductase [Paenibacillus sp. TAB 01]|uniref:Gfo/Idh/MocA family protein n=1 Tax=Paenibacillus sp. TAB 01 TaxID=3368988 RepID=UPI0037520C56